MTATVGGQCAAASTEMLSHVQRQPKYGEYVASIGAAGAIEKLGQAMEAAFVSFDQHLRTELSERDESGCTAIAVVVTPSHIVCANAGDSRGCYFTRSHALALSEDHRPGRPTEGHRIRAAGGSVHMNRIAALPCPVGWETCQNNLELPPRRG